MLSTRLVMESHLHLALLNMHKQEQVDLQGAGSELKLSFHIAFPRVNPYDYFKQNFIRMT